MINIPWDLPKEKSEKPCILSSGFCSINESLGSVARLANSIKSEWERKEIKIMLESVLRFYQELYTTDIISEKLESVSDTSKMVLMSS